MKIIDLFFALSKKSPVANLASGGRNTGDLESYLIGIWRYGKSNNFSIVITLMAVLMIAVICSCGIIKTHKEVGKTSATGSEPANVKTLEYYRNYIQNKLPFKKILWEAGFSEEKIRKLVRRGDSLYVETNANKLYSVSTKTGFRQWQLQLPGSSDFFISTVADLPKKESELKKSINDTEKEFADENKRKGRDEDKIKSLKRDSDSLKEEYVSLRSKDVIYLTCNGSLYCIDRSTGNVIWQNRLPFIPSTVPCATIASVFIGALDYNRVYQIDASLKYEKDWFRAGESIVTTPLYENLTIYFGSSDGKVYAYDTMMKKLLWTYPTEKAIKTDMILDDDILYVGSTDFAVYAIDRYAGVLLWKFETGRPITSPIILDKNQAVSGTNVSNPAIDKIDSSKTLYVYSDKNGLYAVNILTVFIKDNDNPEREKIFRKAKPIWKFEEGKSFLIRGLFYTYVIGLDNQTLYAVLNNQPTEDNTTQKVPRPQIKEKYDLSIFPLRYGDLEENTVYLVTFDGYILSVKE